VLRVVPGNAFSTLVHLHARCAERDSDQRGSAERRCPLRSSARARCLNSAVYGRSRPTRRWSWRRSAAPRSRLFWWLESAWGDSGL